MEKYALCQCDRRRYSQGMATRGLSICTYRRTLSVITSALLGLDSGEAVDSVNAFMIVIQGGAILAVLGLYWSRVQSMIKGILGRDPQGLRLFLAICIAFAPAALIGPFVDDWIEARLMHPVPVLIALGGGGILMIFIGRGRQGRGIELTQLSLLAALAIGLMQLLAMWPAPLA